MKFIHFIGIGGISMSGIARVLQKRGYIVSGSDSTKTTLTEKLESEGIKIFYGHSSANISQGVDLIVKTSTVGDTNPEILEAKERSIKIAERYEMLNLLSQDYLENIGVAGSHGKTTTTSYLWKISQNIFNTHDKLKIPSLFLGSTIYDATINGNCFEQLKPNKNSSLAIYETDESDRSFEKMNINHAIITNIDNDHLEFYSNSFFNLYEAFVTFATQVIQKNGHLLVGIDFEYSENLYHKMLVSDYNKKNLVKSYSLNNKNADYFAENIIDDGLFTIFNFASKDGNILIKNIKIPSIGKHNVFNAVGAISLFINTYPSYAKYIDGNIFNGLNGIDKRFMSVGKYQLKNTQQDISIDIVDDYAHHPTEIKAIINAVNDSKRWDNFLLVFEPHKYTRVVSIYSDFLSAFQNAKDVIMMDIFGISGGLKIDITKQKFANDIIQQSPQANIVLSNSNQQILDDIYNFVSHKYKNGKTLILFIGAGLSSHFAKKAQSFFDSKTQQ